MLLQLGAGLPLGYGRFSAEQLLAMLDLHVYYRAISDRGRSHISVRAVAASLPT